jgi:lipoteichoic acid synthase
MQQLLYNPTRHDRRQRQHLLRWLMLIILFLCALAPSLLFAHEGAPAQAQLVTQQIRYHLDEAGEVFLVWGIDGWKLAPDALRPSGTEQQGAVLHTPMVRQGDMFVATLQVPAGTTIDYVFQITKSRDGSAIIPLFDTNGAAKKDFHTTVDRSGVADASPTVKIAEASPLVAQEIRYTLADAGEVFLVWGINDWKIAPEAMRPGGTTVKGALMYTPMTQDGGSFTAKLQLPADTAIDYVFEITRGQNGVVTEIWDTNGRQDYHTLVGQASVIDIQGAPRKAQPASAPGIMNYGLYALLGVGLVFGAVRALRLGPQPNSSGILASHSLRIVGLGAVLGLLLILMRAEIMGFTQIPSKNLFMSAVEILLAGYYDVFYVSLLMALFLCIVFLLRRHQRGQTIAYCLFVGVAIISLIIGISNIKVVEVLGRPFNYQWLYYSDFLGSLDAQSGIMSNLSPTIVLSILGFCVAMLLAGRLLIEAAKLLLRRYRLRRALLIGCCAGLIVYLGCANWYISRNEWSYFKLANPITSFAASVAAAGATPELFTMDLPDDLVAFPAPQDAIANHAPSQIQPGKIRNVLIFVLESVPAEYIGAYGSPYAVTPELDSYRQNSLLFHNIYAHAPATNASLVSILSSIYPWISYRNLTQDHPDVDMPTLSAELDQRGYRTGFFSSGDMRFQRSDEFLSHRGFDVFQDYQTLACDQQKFQSDINTWDFQDGADDACTTDALLEWIRQDPAQPFFGMLWTVQTHYPYFYSGEETDYGVDDEKLNRYLNALHHADAQLGRLLRELKERGLDESTLVVVVGDHGEAFGRHDQFAHASHIYEENLHIPLLFINPALFHEEEASTLGGTSDIAPSIMEILGLSAPNQWQGQSLFSPSRHKRVYFFAPWSSFRFGYREGNLKFIFDAANNTTEVYDLEQDPDESRNLADQQPDTVAAGYQRLAAWVQYHDRYMKALLPSE